jgi:electron transport complex protein RnfD
LLALSLPPWAPWWAGVIGGLFATVIGKQVFGGLGQNLFNPAMVARVMLLISFPVPMTLWTAPLPMLSANAPGFVDGLRITFGTLPATLDAMSSATLFGYARSELSRGVDLLQSLAATQAPTISLLGERAGSLGETSSLLIAAGGLLLLGLRIISWHIPFAMLATIALFASLMHGIDPARYLSVGIHLLSGAAMLGAFFIATDYVTSPNTAVGQLVFGAGVGFLTYVIRTWGGYPEGVAFAVLLMNALTPVIDRYTRPRIYGRDRRGAPLEIDP